MTCPDAVACPEPEEQQPCPACKACPPPVLAPAPARCPVCPEPEPEKCPKTEKCPEPEPCPALPEKQPGAPEDGGQQQQQQGKQQQAAGTQAGAAPHLRMPWDPLLTASEVQRGLGYYGSGRRLEEVVAKLMRGEPIRAYTLGGSVTKGSGSSEDELAYPGRFFEFLNKTFPHK